MRWLWILPSSLSISHWNASWWIDFVLHLELLLLQQLCKKNKILCKYYIIPCKYYLYQLRYSTLRRGGGGGGGCLTLPKLIFWSGFRRLKDTFQLETSWLPAIPARQTPAWPACEISLRDLRQISLGCFKQDFQQRIICLPLFVVKSQACLSLYIHLFGFSSFQTLNNIFCCWWFMLLVL